MGPVATTIRKEREGTQASVSPARVNEREDTLTSVGQMPRTDREGTGASVSPMHNMEREACADATRPEDPTVRRVTEGIAHALYLTDLTDQSGEAGAGRPSSDERTNSPWT